MSEGKSFREQLENWIKVKKYNLIMTLIKQLGYSCPFGIVNGISILFGDDVFNDNEWHPVTISFYYKKNKTEINVNDLAMFDK